MLRRLSRFSATNWYPGPGMAAGRSAPAARANQGTVPD